ncbi:hypothetical protein M6D93_00025 [Jatrophihabitans telluris]|uniref:DUF1508 domain-containing protein n=1 Tax=Jatrophihabitans telluris TaxID=2038343 RepID=A0ABY4QYM1_9ACTN|nr:hypothetical protein [Jatrophihabitans telluris]UQX88408.1 hypothetical protein M6D93_00025 [Jatrophihabitans telluris]
MSSALSDPYMATGDESGPAPTTRTRTTGGAHFQIYATAPGAPVGWRLLSANNRDLGRGGDTFADFTECRTALLTILARIDGLEPLIRPGRPNRWLWGLREHGRIVVSSGHHYDRIVRCEQARRQFIDLARNAAMPSELTLTAARRATARTARAREPFAAQTRRLGPLGGLSGERVPAIQPGSGVRYAHRHQEVERG